MEKQCLINHNLNAIRVERRIIIAIHFLYGKREPYKDSQNKEKEIRYLYMALHKLLLPSLSDKMADVILNDASDLGCIFLLCKIPDVYENNRLLNEIKKSNNSESEKYARMAKSLNSSIISSMITAEKYSFSTQEKIERRMLLAIHYMKNKIPDNIPDLDEVLEKKLYKKLLPNLKREDAEKILKNFDDIACLDYLNNFDI